MTYNSPKTWKDLVEKHEGPTLSRRDLMLRGLATGAMTVFMSELTKIDLIAKAAAAGTCPAPTRLPGAIAQLFCEGGPAMGARFISEAQASMMNPTMAKNYGISGAANLVRLGPNFVVDKTSPFGMVLMQGPPGYAGGSAAWQTNVLRKVSGGGHLGPFPFDDAAGRDTGLVGGLGRLKPSQLGKDIVLGFTSPQAQWAKGLPRLGSTFTVDGLVNAVGLSPVSMISPAGFDATHDAIGEIRRNMASITKTDTRKGHEELAAAVDCGFYGNTTLIDTTFGANTFNPSNLPALGAKLNVASLNPKDQSMLTAYYQSAMGVVGSVVSQFTSRDYHGLDIQTVVTPADMEDARAIVMFLAACDAAQKPGALIYNSNGQVICDSTTPTTGTIDNVAMNFNCPKPVGDAGGHYNGGLMLFYSPTGSTVNSRWTGTLDANGGVKVSPDVANSREAMAGLYLTALSFINGGNIPAAALTRMQSADVAKNPSKIVLV